MATTVAELVARLSADTDRFDRDMKRSDSSFKKVGKSIGKAALGIGTAVGVGLGITAKIGWDEFNEGARVAAQTNAVLKSTGGVANVTAKQVDRLATSLMKKSGVDDEAIKAGENFLLTFTNVRNEAGKGNDIFSQATKTTLDMSVALGKDMKDAALLSGKALNDPVRGMTALRRVGVSFTTAQEEAIKKMVESGDTMGAQKMILAELNKEFGGSAEAAGKTLPGQLDILKQTFSNTAGEIVGRFVPPLVRFATWLAPLILQALDAIGGFLDRAKERFAGAGGTAAAVWPRVVGALQSVWGFVKEKIFPIIGQLRDIWTTAVQRIAAVLMEHEPQLRRIWERVGKAVQLLAKIAIPILRFIFTEVLPRAIGIALKAMDKATGAIETILKTAQRLGRWFKGSFAGFFTSAWQGIKDLFFDATHWILGQFLGFAERMLKLADKGFGWIPGLGGKIDDARDKISGMRNELDRITRRRYAIRFHTNAAAVAEHIDMVGRAARGSSGDFGSFGLGATSLVALGRQLQSMGFQVGEHPSFGGVRGRHVPGSYHYAGRALDINWPGGGVMEMAKLDWLNSRLKRMPGVKELLWRTAGHFDHLHLAMAKGGIFTKPWTGMVSVAERGKPEGFVPLPAGASSLRGGPTLNFYGPIYGANERQLADEIYRLWRRGQAVWDRGNGG